MFKTILFQHITIQELTSFVNYETRDTKRYTRNFPKSKQPLHCITYLLIDIAKRKWSKTN